MPQLERRTKTVILFSKVVGYRILVPASQPLKGKVDSLFTYLYRYVNVSWKRFCVLLLRDTNIDTFSEADFALSLWGFSQTRRTIRSIQGILARLPNTSNI